MANSWTLDKVGPMARSAQDCMFVLNAINGIDSKDPTVHGSWRFTPAKNPARIGVLEQSPSGISKPVADAIDVLRKIGHAVQEIKLPICRMWMLFPSFTPAQKSLPAFLADHRGRQATLRTLLRQAE